VTCFLAESPFDGCAASRLCIPIPQVFRKASRQKPSQGESMKVPHAQARSLALCFLVLMFLIPLGCKSADGEGAGQSGAAISGPLTILPQYQTRAPRTCSKVKSPPSEAVAAVLVQCTMETDSLFGVGLIQDIKLEIGKSRRFVYQTDAGLTEIDLDAPVYPLQGSYTSYLCKTITTQNPAGKNRKEREPRGQRVVLQEFVWRLEMQNARCSAEDGSGRIADGVLKQNWNMLSLVCVYDA
jgi:hypothetical protein